MGDKGNDTIFREPTIPLVWNMITPKGWSTSSIPKNKNTDTIRKNEKICCKIFYQPWERWSVEIKEICLMKKMLGHLYILLIPDLVT